MNRPETERALLASLKHVTTWEDMYEWFDNQVRACVQIGHPAVVFGALFFMHSFLQAMRELPEEGNIEALKERMIRVLVYEQHEKFSVDVGLFVGPPPTQEQESFAQEIYETLMSSMRNPGAKD